MSTPDQRFKDQVVIVTGSSSGIGKACAIYFGQLGAKVVVNYSANAEAGNEVLEEITKGGGTAILVKADVSKEEEVKAMFNETIANLRKAGYSCKQCRTSTGFFFSGNDFAAMAESD